jgi:glycosyltransferase involved in cell wall biosynthesis
MSENGIWAKAQESEAAWWRTEGLGAINSYHEEFKQHVYSEKMGLEFDEWDRINLMGRNVLDIGGGPVSILLKTFNAGRRKVIDPLDMPQWAIDRYKDAGIDVLKVQGEEMNESGWDEVLIYNCLQHVQDPVKLIKNAMDAGKIIRVFEFLERPANEGHPHVLTEKMLDDAFGQKGTVGEIPVPVRASGTPAIVGKVYWGVFSGTGMSVKGMKPGLIPEDIELNWVNTGTEFSYPYYIAIQTALKTQKPKKFNLWLVKEPSGKYFDAVKDIVTIRRVNEIIPDFPALQGKPKEFQEAHLVDYYRLKVMYENGGIYADLDSLSTLDYCGFALRELKEKEFVASVVLQPHIYGAGWFAARKHSPIVKLMLDKTVEKLNSTPEDFKWGNSGPDILNAVCVANLTEIAETPVGALGGAIEIYQLFNDKGELPYKDHLYIHVATNSIGQYWSAITEDWVETSNQLYARITRELLSKEERHPIGKRSLNSWMVESRRRYRPLFDILKSRDCRNIMEVGVYNGQNALLMIKEAAKRVPEEEIEYFGFDLFDKITPETMEKEYGSGPIPSMSLVSNFLARETKAKIHLYEGFSRDTVPHSVIPKMDVIFIDGGHSVETIRTDWENIKTKKLMKASTVVVFDDYYPEVPFIGCKTLAKEMSPKYSVEIMPETDDHTASWGWPLKVQFMCVTPARSKLQRPPHTPALHVLGLAHTKTNREFMACAYTQKVYKLCKMMMARGYDVYHYGAEGSNPECTENVEVLSDAVQLECYHGYDWKKEPFRHNPADLAYQTFDINAIREIKKRALPGDLLLISMGNYQKPISDALLASGSIYPGRVIEMGIGYTGVFTDRRIFESYAWMHYIYGQLDPTNSGGANGCNYDVVIPNYYDPDDFEFRTEKDDYFLYIGRLIGRKGVHIAAQLCQRIGARLVIAGQGTIETVRACIGDIPPYVEFVGYADAEKRSQLMSHAKAVIVMTEYLEPFGGVNVEAMMCGTPVITSDWGGFPETNQHGVTGYRCHTMDQMVWAAKNVDKLDPVKIREYAVNNYSLDRISRMYDEYFKMVDDLDKAGWYELHQNPNEALPGFPNSSPARTELDWLKRY